MPTVADRVAQMVVKQVIEPILDSIFLADSYGYRPNKSALDAVGVTRERCWRYDWVLEFDIRGLFDNIDHDLLLRAVRKHVTCKWALLYIERWLKAPMVQEDGTLVERSRGTPQGGVVSPILANLFMHYTFDVWMVRSHPGLPWCRYADDGLVHCRNEQEAQALKSALQARLAECRLELHPTKTKIVYCRDGKRKGKYPNVKFDFLGFCFRPRLVQNFRDKTLFGRLQSGSQSLGDEGDAGSDSGLETLASNTVDLAGYCSGTQSTPSGVDWILRALCPLGTVPIVPVHQFEARTWVMRKFKRFKHHTVQASQFLQKLAKERVDLFVHWRIVVAGTFA